MRRERPETTTPRQVLPGPERERPDVVIDEEALEAEHSGSIRFGDQDDRTATLFGRGGQRRRKCGPAETRDSERIRGRDGRVVVAERRAAGKEIRALEHESLRRVDRRDRID